MKVSTLNGHLYEWKYSVHGERNCSTLHARAEELIRLEYPRVRIIEEVPIKISLPGPILYLDLYVPDFSLCVEVMGSQHYKFSSHYHGDQQKFTRYQNNDRLKQEWCGVNNILFVEFLYNESDIEWKQKLRTAIGGNTETS